MDKRWEVNHEEALQISNEIGEYFAKGNSDYDAIQLEIENKHGKGSVMLALRCLAGWVNRAKENKNETSK